MTDDEDVDRIIKEMAMMRGITPEEMEQRLVATAQALEESWYISKSERFYNLVSLAFNVLFVIALLLLIVKFMSS